MLIDAGADVNHQTAIEHGQNQTKLHAILSNNDPDTAMVKVLLDADADPHLRSLDTDKTAIDLAREMKHDDETPELWCSYVYGIYLNVCKV